MQARAQALSTFPSSFPETTSSTSLSLPPLRPNLIPKEPLQHPWSRTPDRPPHLNCTGFPAGQTPQLAFASAGVGRGELNPEPNPNPTQDWRANQMAVSGNIQLKMGTPTQLKDQASVTRALTNAL